MEAFILANEPTIRLAAFLGIFAAVGLAELAWPRRALTVSKARRWFGNILIVVLNTLVVRLLFATAAVGMAAYGAARGWGLFNVVDLPVWVEIVLAVIVLDFIIYLQHVMFHAVPAFWRLHMMHHADLDFDLTTGARFHPIEIVLSMLLKLAAVAALGAPVVAVVIFEVLLNGTAMFNHGNVKLPLGVDRVLRLFVVTPDMHRVHHSIVPEETNSNFGFNLPWWDRLCGTYRAQPAAGHDGMTIGIKQIRDPAMQWPWRMLALPFVTHAEGYALNERRFDDDSAPAP